jgi:acetyltransferase-like isoleucine patch superfamily enzyme
MVLRRLFSLFAAWGLKWYNMTLGSRVLNREGLRVGEGSAWNVGCYINAEAGVFIGKNVLIGPYCVLQSSNHAYSLVHKRRGSIVLGDKCWLGAHVVVLPGVVVGEGSVVGAGAVVSKSLPAFCVAVGVPAKVISSVFKVGVLEVEKVSV